MIRSAQTPSQAAIQRFSILWMLLGIWLFSGILMAQPQVSVLISSPRQKSPYTIYGHAAIRITDREKGIDDTYNYGVFDMSQPNFVYEFLKGTSESYMLEKTPTEYYIPYYLETGATVYEMDLNLSPTASLHILNLLEENLLPQNTHYRYNYAFDNCATQIWNLLQKALAAEGASVRLPEENPKTSWREILNSYATAWSWYQLGTDLALGSDLDRPITQEERLFLPMEMYRLFQQTTIHEGTDIIPLVLNNRSYPSHPTERSFTEKPTPWYLRPAILLFLFLLLEVFLLFRAPQRMQRIFYSVLYFGAFLSGSILFFLSFVSIQPFTSHNWNLLLLHPLHLLALIPLWTPCKAQRIARIYHYANLLALTTYFIITLIGIQTPPRGMIFVLLLLLLPSIQYPFPKKRERTMQTRSTNEI